MEEGNKKLSGLDDFFRKAGGALIAFSGGCDSSFLLARANAVLRERVAGVTVASGFYPPWELESAKRFADKTGVRHIILPVSVLDEEKVASNPVDRCYHCKKGIFTRLWEVARGEGLDVLVDGTNASDSRDYRPGSRALSELGVSSPLRDLGITKEEVREFSRAMGLPTWNAEPQSCFATRFPYGTRITGEKLFAVQCAEEKLRGLGFANLRLRCHGDLARLEVPEAEIEKASGVLRERVLSIIRESGFKFASIDLCGYRFGSMD